MNHQCHKDFPMEECLWPKRCTSFSDDIWNCYPSNLHSNFTKKTDLEAVPKTRKKLAIIDPVTGKNVLESVGRNNQEEQDNAYSGNSESSESFSPVITAEKDDEDCFCNEVKAEPSLQICEEATSCCPGDKVCYDKLKNYNTFNEEDFCKEFEKNPSPGETSCHNNKEDPSSVKKDKAEASVVDSETMSENVDEFAINSGSINEDVDASKLLSRKGPKTCQIKEAVPNEKHIIYQARDHPKKVYVSKENAPKQSDSLRDSVKVKDKSHPLRQEQQKMAILQSFLRYKKYELDENARNLDEKRIEIANWECNLYKLAKRLHEKELWLESKSEILFNKAQQLAEREKALSKRENKSLGDYSSSKISKETWLSERKIPFCSSSDSAWDETPTKIRGSYMEDEDNSYFGCASNSNKILEDASGNVDKYKADACSLDDLEKNIMLIEKIHSSDNVEDANLENKIEAPSSSSVLQKNEIDPFGYSKGRRYLPEHIKYWLNKRDKSAL